MAVSDPDIKHLVPVTEGAVVDTDVVATHDMKNGKLSTVEATEAEVSINEGIAGSEKCRFDDQENAEQKVTNDQENDDDASSEGDKTGEGDVAEYMNCVSAQQMQHVIQSFREIDDEEKPAAFSKLLDRLPHQHLAAQLCLVGVDGDRETQMQLSAMYEEHIVKLNHIDPALAFEAVKIAKAILTLHSECKRTLKAEETITDKVYKVMDDRIARIVLGALSVLILGCSIAGLVLESWNIGVVFSTLSAVILIMVFMQYLGFDDHESDKVKIDKMMKSEQWQKSWQSLHPDNSHQLEDDRQKKEISDMDESRTVEDQLEESDVIHRIDQKQTLLSSTEQNFPKQKNSRKQQKKTAESKKQK